MSKRSAHYTIKGYLYQFNESILALLDKDNKGNLITIEGIEDYDIHDGKITRAHQCKYHEAQTFAYSKIRKPIILMLNHYINSSKDMKYYLRIHFGDKIENKNLKLDLKTLKEKILTYKERKKEIKYWQMNRITTKRLNSFLKNIEINFVSNFDTHKNELLTNIASTLSCSVDVAEEYYYPKALDYISEKAIQSEISSRKASYAELLEKLQNTFSIFNHLYLQYKGEEKFVNLIKKKIKENQSLMGVKQKYVFIDLESFNGFKIVEIVDLIVKTQEKYYRVNQSLWDSLPWAFIVKGSLETINLIKAGLINKNIYFEDGREGIQFNSTFFNSEPIKKKNNNGKGSKIGTSSYVTKILSWETYSNNTEFISVPDVIFSFGKIDEGVLRGADTASVFSFKDLDNINMSKKILLGE